MIRTIFGVGVIALCAGFGVTLAYTLLQDRTLVYFLLGGVGTLVIVTVTAGCLALVLRFSHGGGGRSPAPRVEPAPYPGVIDGQVLPQLRQPSDSGRTLYLPNAYTTDIPPHQ